MIYEMRIYETVPGKLDALNRRFANITLPYFDKYGLKVIGFWTEDVGTNNTLVYILAFDNIAHREEAWQNFRADQERAKAFAETEKDGPLVARITNRILKPTDYSPLK